MTSSTTSDRWNPFSWRAAELAMLRDDPVDQARRAELELELLMAEADEVARGALHLTIVHGDPSALDEATHLSHFYDLVKQLVATAGMHRLRVEPDHVIVTVSGSGARECIDQLVDTAESMNPGHWRIARSARPDLTPAS